MHRSKIFRFIALLGMICLVGAVLGSSVMAQSTVRWKMQSAFGSKLPHLGPPAVKFTEDVKIISGGTLLIKFFEPGALVPALECWDSVSKGAIDSCWTTAGYHVGKIPALSFFTTVPFGPDIGEMTAWLWYGGGEELKRSLYAPHNLYPITGFAIGPETSGWFRTEIKSLDQLKGMKMRFFGLGAKVMQKIGVSTQLLAAADIYPALERGVIDATEFSMPTIDLALGFYQIAKYNYFPGWHQRSSFGEFLTHKPTWEKLSAQHKRIIEVALGNVLIKNYAESEAKIPEAMRTMGSKYGVNIMRWPDATLKRFQEIWLEVLKEESAKDPVFKRVADHFYNFRAQYRIWGEAQQFNNSYLK